MADKIFKTLPIYHRDISLIHLTFPIIHSKYYFQKNLSIQEKRNSI
jgi:hypothetical protein